MKVAIFGGSFDPIHQAHLIVAESCREQAKLEQVIMMPAATSPLKPAGPRASDRHRLEMIKLAIAGHTPFTVSTFELDRGGVSYTVDLLEHLTNHRPEDDLFLILGADSLQDFERWKQPERICQLAIPLIVARRGAPTQLELLRQLVDPPRFEVIRQHQFETPRIDISSTAIRADVALGRSIRFQLPRSVERYIETHRLYRD